MTSKYLDAHMWLVATAYGGHMYLRFILALIAPITLISCNSADVASFRDSNSSDLTDSFNDYTEAELWDIVDQILAGDTSTIDAMTDEELEAFIDALQHFQVYVDVPEDSLTFSSTLPACSGYWGHYAYAEVVEKTTANNPLYSVGPNCMMWADAPDDDGPDDCGDDYDDYMLSFYLGYHSQSASSLKGMLKWTSSNVLVQSLIGSLEGRLYEQTIGGTADNYNFYACVDDFFGGYLSAFQLRKYN